MGNSSNKPDIPRDSLRPRGLYGECEWDNKIVKRMILQLKLAPCHAGEQECGDKFKWEECPVCLLFYPGGLNRAICCNKPICTECYLQIQKPRQHNSRCPFCNHQPYLVKFEGLRSREEILKEEEEEQKVLELKFKIQMEEENASRLEQQQRKEKELANRIAPFPPPPAPPPVDLNDIVVEQTPTSTGNPVNPARLSARGAMNHPVPPASLSESSRHTRSESNSSSSTSTNPNTASQNPVTHLPAFYRDFVPTMTTGSGVPDDQMMLDEAIRLSLLESETNLSNSSNKMALHVNHPAPSSSSSSSSVSSASASASTSSSASSSSASSSNQPNIFFSSFNFVTNVNITAPQAASLSIAAVTKSSRGESANLPGHNNNNNNNPFQIHNSNHFRIPNASNSSTLDNNVTSPALSTTPTGSLTLTRKNPPDSQASSTNKTDFSSPSADSPSSSSIPDDEETQLQVAIALSLSLLEEQSQQRDQQSNDDEGSEYSTASEF